MKRPVAEDRAILITGVTRGLGSAMTRAMSAAGHTIFGCGRSANRVEALRREFPPPHHFAVVDVANDAMVAAWAKEALARRIPDLLINNAAVITPERPLWEVPEDEFSCIVDINIKGVQNVIRHFTPAMVKRRSGIIINMSSGWGRGADPGFGPYITTKWAIEGLTQALALELPSGMAAVSLSPGIIDTAMLREAFGDGASQYDSPETWAGRATPFILAIGPNENGRQLATP